MENIIEQVQEVAPAPSRLTKDAVAGVWTIIFRWVLIATIALIPLIFLPFTVSPVSLTKQVFFIILTLIGVLSWAGISLTEGRTVIIKGWFSWASLALFLFLAVNVILAKSPLDGFRVDALPLAFTTLGSALIFSQLMGGLARNKRDGFLAFLAIFFSLSLLSLLALAQIFGLSIFPWDFAKVKSFTPVGSMNSLAILAGVGLVLGVSLILFGRSIRRSLLWIIAGAATLNFLVLFLVNFRTAWMTFGLGMVVVLLALVGRQGLLGLRITTLPILLLAIAVLFAIIRSPVSLFQLEIPLEVTPNWSTSLNVAKSTMGESTLRTIFGAGPGNFPFQWSIYKPLAINQTAFWGVRFPSAVSGIMTILTENGVVGTLIFLGLLTSIGLVLLGSIQAGIQEGSEPILQAMLMGGSAAALVLLTAFFLYPASFTHNIVLFGIVGMLAGTLASLHRSHIYEITLVESSAKTIVISLLLILLMIVSIATLYFEGERYAGALAYERGLRAWNRESKFDEASRLMLRSIALDRREDQYVRSLAQLYLVKIAEIVRRPIQNQQELQSIQNEFQIMVGDAVRAAQELKNRNPIDAVNLSIRASIYENLIPLVSGADSPALEAYSEAANFDPKNPAHMLDRGRAHIVIAETVARNAQIAQSQRQLTQQQIDEANKRITNELNEAVADLTKAVELKPDLAAAHFLLAQTYDRKGEIEKAIAATENVKNFVPQDVGVRFQLGFLYYKVDDLSRSQQEFEAAVALNENYSNARYFLGLIYDRAGDRQRAIEQFQRIEALNPDNQEVKQILTNLRADKAALAGIVPPAPAPEKRRETPVQERGGVQSPVRGR